MTITEKQSTHLINDLLLFLESDRKVFLEFLLAIGHNLVVDQLREVRTESLEQSATKAGRKHLLTLADSHLERVELEVPPSQTHALLDSSIFINTSFRHDGMALLVDLSAGLAKRIT